MSTSGLRSREKERFFPLIFLLLLASLFLALLFGTVGPIGYGNPTRISWEEFFCGLFFSSSSSNIIYTIRLPRILLAALVGAALSISGVTMQGLFRNPLAEPYILGISSGAAVGASISFIVGGCYYSPFTLPLFAFAGAGLTVMAVYRISLIGGRIQTDTLLLAGIAIASFLAALTFYFLYAFEKDRDQIFFWLMGSFNQSTMLKVIILLSIVLLGGIVLYFFSRDLNAILLGEETAQQLGVDVNLTKKVSLLMASLLAGAAVAFVGIIGFVGLIIPHIMRIVFGPDHRILIPSSAMAGAIFLLWADTSARVILPGQEIPIGIITAFCGAPFFIYLLRCRKGGYVYASKS